MDQEGGQGGEGQEEAYVSENFMIMENRLAISIALFKKATVTKQLKNMLSK